jgi:ATP phosphoribosyltransferase regulatory subunit
MNSIQDINIFLKNLFTENNFQYVDLPLVYNSELFYETSGEDIRRRMFSFTNNSGDEMCLRPDLTIPTCKHFLENIKKFENGQLCYSGPVFRSSLTSTEQSLELNQSGIEIIYKDSSKISNYEKEFQAINLAIETINQIGINDFSIRISSISLFNLFINSLDLPQRWKQRLLRHFYRRDYFDKLLNRISDGVGYDKERKSNIIRDVFGDDKIVNEEIKDILLSEDQLKTGSRTIDEIASRFNLKSESVVSSKQGKEIQKVINEFLSLNGPIQSIDDQMNKFINDFDIQRFDVGQEMLNQLSSNLIKISAKPIYFDCDFGHSIEFYDGIIFEITNDLNSDVLISGGRYDKLLNALEDKDQFSAVGFATNNNNILKALTNV